MKELINYLLALPLAFLANVALGAEIGRLKEQFSKKILIDGLFKGLMLYIAIGLLVGVVYFIPDLQVTFDGTNLGVILAIQALLLGGIGWYVVEVLRKMATLLKGVDREIEQLEDGGIVEFNEQELG